MFKRLKGKMGIVGNGILFMLVTIISTIGVKGFLFGGGNPTSSIFISAATVLTAYSQSPHATGDFREKRAIDICEFYNTNGMYPQDNCPKLVSSMNEEQLLEYIDADGNYLFYEQKNNPVIVKTGGRLRSKILAMQK